MLGLGDPDGKLRTAFSAAIATIAIHDWPEEWPDLMPILLEGLKNGKEPDKGRPNFCTL